MPKYQLDIPHTLAPDEAKKRIDERPASCRRDYGASCTWKSDNELAVSRKGLDARVMLEPSRVRIDLNLGFLMTPFAELIKTGITKKLSAILTHAADAARDLAILRRRVCVVAAVAGARRRERRLRCDASRSRARPPRSPAFRSSDPKSGIEMLKLIQRMRVSRWCCAVVVVEEAEHAAVEQAAAASEPAAEGDRGRASPRSVTKE